MKLLKLSTDQYLYIQERDDEVALDITLYDKNKKEIDGGVLETDTDISNTEAIIECLDFMDLSKFSYTELDPDEIENFIK